MRCKCGECTFDTVDYELLVHLQYLRAHFGRPVTLTSVCRCPAHNRRVGGKPGSLHLVGRAADKMIEGVPPEDVYAYFDTRWPDKYGLGLYPGRFTHFDTRGGPAARWTG